MAKAGCSVCWISFEGGQTKVEAEQRAVWEAEALTLPSFLGIWCFIGLETWFLGSSPTSPTSQNCDLGEVTQLFHAILSTSELLDTLLQSPYCNTSQRIIVCAKMESLSLTAQTGLNSAMILLLLSPECWITGTQVWYSQGLWRGLN